MDRISVIVPIYKVEAYLDTCVRSITVQTYPHLEIILVDDGSPDRCGAMCDQWAAADPRIRVIHKPNGGLSDARNAGLAIATGKYVVFVDSDDRISPEYVELLYEAVRRTGAPMAACDLQAFYRDEEISDAGSGAVSLRTAAEALQELMAEVGVRAVVWNKLYRADLLQGEQFPAGRHHEDEFFTYRLLHKAGQIAWVDRPLYFYRQRPGSIMQGFSLKRLDALDAFLERQALLRVHYPELYRSDKGNFCVYCLMYYAAGIGCGYQDLKMLRQEVLRRRKQVHFTAGELRSYPMRIKLMILGSRYGLHPLGLVLARRIAGGTDKKEGSK